MQNDLLNARNASAEERFDVLHELVNNPNSASIGNLENPINFHEKIHFGLRIIEHYKFIFERLIEIIAAIPNGQDIRDLTRILN